MTSILLADKFSRKFYQKLLNKYDFYGSNDDFLSESFRPPSVQISTNHAIKKLTVHMWTEVP